MPAHISVRAGKHLTFRNVTFRDMGSVALNVTDGSQDIRIDACKFHNISGSAISLGQTDDWRQTDLAQQNARLHVANCDIRNVT